MKCRMIIATVTRTVAVAIIYGGFIDVLRMKHLPCEHQEKVWLFPRRKDGILKESLPCF